MVYKLFRYPFDWLSEFLFNDQFARKLHKSPKYFTEYNFWSVKVFSTHTNCSKQLHIDDQQFWHLCSTKAVNMSKLYWPQKERKKYLPCCQSAVFIIFPQQSLRFLQSFNSSGQLYMHVAWSDLAKVDTKNLRQQYDIVSSTIFTKPCAPHCPYNYAVSLKRISLLTCVYPFMWWHFFIAFIAAPTLLANENGKER